MAASFCAAEKREETCDWWESQITRADLSEVECGQGDDLADKIRGGFAADALGALGVALQQVLERHEWVADEDLEPLLVHRVGQPLAEPALVQLPPRDLQDQRL